MSSLTYRSSLSHPIYPLFILPAEYFRIWQKRRSKRSAGIPVAGVITIKKSVPNAGRQRGNPFWTAFIGIDRCAIYDCCTNDRKLPHCGKCPELMCERFNRIKEDPNMNEAEAVACLAEMENELRARK